MKLDAGERMAWPSQPFSAERSDLLANMDGLAFARIPAGLTLPGLSSETTQQLKIELVATQDNRIRFHEGVNPEKGHHWLEEKLHRQKTLWGDDNSNQTETIAQLFDQLHQQLERRNKQRIETHRPLDTEAAAKLFRSLELAADSEENSDGQLDPKGALLHCIATIRGINRDEVVDHAHSPDEPRRHLQYLLENNDLLGRDVLISEDSLYQDCGNLIAFFEDDGKTPALLRSTTGGYRIWVPSRMKRPQSIWKCQNLVGELSPRMVAVSPALTKKDLSTVGLLQFAFGKPTNITRYIVSGLLIGLAVGFLLSIGRSC